MSLFSTTLLTFARRHGIQATDNVSAQELSQAMQENWLRKTEHQYQIPPGAPSAEDLDLLKNLDMVNDVFPPAGKYAGALVLGATVIAVRKRLAFLAKQNVQLEKVYMLGGARPLDPVKESSDVLRTPAELSFKDAWVRPRQNQMPTTEYGMMQLVFDQSVLPTEWQGVFVNAPLQPTPDGKTRHPNTTDTVKEFLTAHPVPGEYLVVSSQPFVARQILSIASVLPSDFKTVGIGYGAAATTPLKTFMDEMARLLFEQLKC